MELGNLSRNDAFSIAAGFVLLVSTELLIGVEGHEIRDTVFFGGLPFVLAVAFVGRAAFIVSGLFFSTSLLLLAASGQARRRVAVTGASALFLFSSLYYFGRWGLIAVSDLYFFASFSMFVVVFLLIMLGNLSRVVTRVAVALISTIWFFSHAFPKQLAA